MDNKLPEGFEDISRFLEKYSKEEPTVEVTEQVSAPSEVSPAIVSARQEQFNQSFEKLEAKIEELEKRFAASSARSEAVMEELVRTRQAMQDQRSKDAILANITATIANLKESVDNLSRAQQARPVASGAGPAITDLPAADSLGGEYVAMSFYKPDNYRTAEQAKLREAQDETEKAQYELLAEKAGKEKLIASWMKEREEQQAALASVQADNTAKEHLISNLQQKTSQLKAVNVALDREIKRSQEERMEALRKSAEQAKEILSLRNALTAAEERLKSFDFEGRIISIKREYEQKVSTLETQLHEISATCIKQVEEIEALKTENIHLHKLAEEREQLEALYEAKTRELESAQAEAAQLRSEVENPKRLVALTERMQLLQKEHDSLSERLVEAQQVLQTVKAEKETVEQNFQTLRSKINENDAVIENLKEKISVLMQENQDLKKQQTQAQAAAVSDTAPATPRTPVLVRQPVANKPSHLQAKAEEPLPVEEDPVAVTQTKRPSVQTEADLPEIRVAKPVPQNDVEIGEDFLEKTDSFIGRMKWSIFREDK